MKIINKPLIFDGAMGTYYMETSNKQISKCELANIHDTENIIRIHKEYIDAGCNAIRTNTFAANKNNLECDNKMLAKIIKSGYELAIEATRGSDTLVFACIGPIEGEDYKLVIDQYTYIIDTFIDLGAKRFIFETFPSDEHLYKIAKYIKKRTKESFIIAQLSVNNEGYTRLGHSGQELFYRLSFTEDIDACGFNCLCGPAHLLKFIKSLDKTDKVLSVMPNAGYPEIFDNRTFYNASDFYFASMMQKSISAGASIIGGCCGTTPAHISRLVKYIMHGIDIKPDMSAETKRTVKNKKKYDLYSEKINIGQKIIVVELDPPVDTEISFFMSSAKHLKDIGVDAITIADCPIAKARADSSIMACKVKKELGIKVIPHITCRDRNINALKALLLGLGIEGISDILVVTGDPVPTEQRSLVKPVFSFNSLKFSKYVSELNKSLFHIPFNIYAALNINAVNFNKQLEYAIKKVQNGVSCFLTQPVLSDQAVYNLKLAKKILGVRILAGILPVINYMNACFLENEISGIHISEDIMNLYLDCHKERANELAVEISVDMASKVHDYCDGYYIITPFKRIDLVDAIIQRLLLME